MAIITGYTAEKMNEFNEASVVGGSVNTSGSLILKTRGGKSIDAGNVRGPKGEQADAENLVPTFVPRWKPKTPYNVGQLVIAPSPANVIVACISAHTSSAEFSADLVSRWGGYLFAGTNAERTVIFGNPTTDAAISALANKQVRFYNKTKGWWESYYSPPRTGMEVTPLIDGNPAGWYPDAGSDIRVSRGIQSAFQRIEAKQTIEPEMGDLLVNTKEHFSKGQRSGIILPFGGFYRVFGSAYVSGAVATTITAYISLDINSTLIRGSTAKHTMFDVEANVQGIYPFQKTDVIRMFIRTEDGLSAWGVTGYNGTRLTVEYAGPPLAN